MRKILSLLMSVLFAGSLMATSITVPATTLDLQTPAMVTSAGWYGEKAYYLDDDLLIVSGYESYKSVAKQTWITFVSTGSSGSTWTASAPFKGSSYYTTASYATLKAGRYTAYAVTGCDSVWVYGKNNSATVYLLMNVYDITGSTATTIDDSKVSATYAVKNTSITSEMVLKQALDASKTYLIVTTGVGTSNSRVLEMAFFRHPAPAATTKTIYLNTGGSSLWGIDSPDFFAHSWKDGVEATDVKLTHDEGNYYKAVVPIANDKVVFTRQKPGSTEIAWSGENFYNQTADLTIPSGKNCFTITGWSNGDGGKSGGEWSKYPTYYVAGTMTNWATGKVEMDENGSYKFEDLAAGKHEIKVIDNAGEWHGFDQLDKTSSSVNVYGEGTGNVKFVMAEAGDVTITYDGSKIVVKGSFVAPTTKFTVTVPAGTENAYIAGNFNKWTPAPMALEAGETNKFSWTIDGDPVDTAEYKYLAGPDWKYVEVDAAGNYLADNRTYAAADVVAKWLAVPVVNKYAKVKAAPVNWTGHYIISWSDLKPHTAISGSNFVAAADAAAFTDGDTISVLEGSDVDIRFSETAGAYTIKLPNGKYIKLPSSNAVNEDDAAMALYLGYYKGTNQEGVQIADKADLTSTSARMIYRNGTNERSYTGKINNSDYKLPTLYRLVNEAFDCLDGPYAIRVNGTDIVETKKVDDFVDGEDVYKQYVAYLSLKENDKIEVVNTSCGAAWLPTIQDAGLASHFVVAEGKATTDTAGCFDLYFKMLYGKDKLYIGPGICPDDTIRFSVRGDGEGLFWTSDVESKKDTLELGLKAGEYKLKVFLGGDASDAANWKGFADLTKAEIAEGLSADDDGNICFKLAADGVVKVVYKEGLFKLIGDFYVRPIVKKDVRLVPGIWAEADAKIAAWIWDKDGEMPSQWTDFFAPIAAGNDTLSAKVDQDADSIVFVRFNPEGLTEPDWAAKWNELKDSIQWDKATFTITDMDKGTWKDVPMTTAFFVNTAAWEKVQAFVWLEGEGVYRAWPGEQMTKTGDKVLEKDVFAYTFPAAYTSIIFNNQVKNGDQWEGSQTEDLVFDAAKPYYHYEESKWYASLAEMAEIKPAKYFVAGDSAFVKDAADLPADKAWKANVIKAEEDAIEFSLKADQEYKLKVVSGAAWKGFSDLSKTVIGLSTDDDNNIVFKLAEAGKVTITFNATKFEIEGDFALPVVALAGTFNDWTPAPLNVATSKLTATIKVDLEVKQELDSFKIVSDGKWLSLAGDEGCYRFHRGHTEASHINGVDVDNFVIAADKAGEYIFTWTFADSTLAITFPQAIYTVAGSAALFEKEWDPTAADNDMVLSEGLFVWEKKNLVLRKGNFTFKVMKEHDGANGSWPDEDYVLAIDKNAKYDVKITFNEATKEVKATATWIEDVELDPVANLRGLAEDKPWTVGEDMTLATDKKSASITKHLKPTKVEGDTLQFKMYIDEAEWRSNAYRYHRGFVGAAGIDKNEAGNMEIVVDVEGDYIFTWTFENDSLGITFPPTGFTYTVAGAESLCGSNWDETDVTNDMTLTDGLFVWEKADVILKIGNIEFKVVQNHAWNEGATAWPEQNFIIAIEKNGKYDVKITFNEVTKEITAKATLKEEIEIDPTAKLMGIPDWNGADMELATDKKSASVTLNLKPSDEDGDTLVFKVKINDAWRSNGYLYHRGFVGAAGITGNMDADPSQGIDGNMSVVVDVEGDYTFTWTFDNDSLGITFPKLPEPALANGFYLIGQNGWDVAALDASLLFAIHDEQAGEYKLHVELEKGQKIKVVEVKQDKIVNWYPSGADFEIDETFAGEKDIYFKPAGSDAHDWARFGGNFWIGANTIKVWVIVAESFGWNNVYAHVWKVVAENSISWEAWPGSLLELFAPNAAQPAPARVMMQKLDENKYEFDCPVSYDNILFNNGSDGDGNQTVDLVVNEAKPYFVISEEKDGVGHYKVEQSATGIDNADAAIQAVKVLENGQIFILKGGKVYNVTGQLVK